MSRRLARRVGADPGPACFDRRGTLPTVTDAQLLLGYLDPDYFLGERMRLNLSRSEQVIQAQIADPLNMTLLDSAAGIVHLANMNMAYAIRNITIERGHDPREFSLVCYGGGGGLFAGFLLNELEASAAIIPLHPATFSSWGLLNADYREDDVRTYLMPFTDLSANQLKTELDALETDVRLRFADYGIDSESTTSQFRAAMRYRGQEHTVKVPILACDFANGLDSLRRRLDTLHEKAYALSLPDSEAEIVNLQVSILGITRKPALKRIAATSRESAVKGRRKVTIRDYGADIDAAVFDRSKLAPGSTLQGPAIIEEWTSTTLVLPDLRANVDEFGNLIIRRVGP